MPRVHIRPAAQLANAVTTARLLLACVVAGLVVRSLTGHPRIGLIVALATAALLLDAVDGPVARHTGACTRFGARYDMEVDAFLVLALSVHVAATVAWWVLLIGLARYLLLVAGWIRPWLRAELPQREWAKVVAAVQGVVLTVVTAGVLPRWAALIALVVALGLLAESFGHQVHRLRRARDRGRAMPRVPSAAATVAAYGVVWLALVAPDRMSDLSPAALVRVPLELLVLVALGVLLPAPVRRPLSVALGVVLALLVIVRALDIGFGAVLDRRFDLLNDSYYLGPAIGVVRDSSGTTAAVGAVVAAVVLLVLLVLLLSAAVARATSAAARHRRVAVPAVAGLAVLGSLSLVTGASVASVQTSALAVRQVRTVGTDLADRRVFSARIAADEQPPAGLLERLHGKDVLLVFVESYGRVAVQDTSHSTGYSTGVRAVLDRGTAQLRAAGYGSRSAFLTSPTFGAASWLAHATLQSGLWVDSQQRYDQLVTSRHSTLTSLFERAGWRTVFDVPAITKDWAEGRRFYGYDELYDARNVGYRGPRFSYATMPDQFTLAALGRNELTPGVRRPVMAEVDLVSSHHPWTPLPPLLDWATVGDGSVFDDVPATGGDPDEVFRDPDEVRAAYGRSIEYTWQALVSWLVQRQDRDLVVVALGDHQPHSYVTGDDPGHDVPITVIARDPRVLSPITGWGWDDGLLPSPDAPVQRMDRFRDRFLAAFSDPTREGSIP